MNASEWQQAKSVIFAAVTRSSAEREAYIAQRCADSTLRAEIESLLRALDQPDPLADPALDQRPESAALTPGQMIGPYVILDRLGHGGMGEVFLASDSRLQRKVALKCLLPSPRNLTADILREARVAARITHPNVAAIHDLIDGQTRAFIVMEYVEGETLGERLKRERLPVAAVIGIGRQLASALSAAHAAGIIHRDLKPGNIQIACDGSVKVLDFGVAHVMSTVAPTMAPTAAASTAVVAAPALAGTPGYMAPEQMLGGPVDARSDIFSLGVVLYEMATGRRLFAGADPFTAIVSIAKSCARADDLDPELPRGLADILARALDIDPAERFQSAGDVERALAELEIRPQAATPVAPDDAPTTTEADVRGFRERLILADTPFELRRLRYEVQEYLAARPHDVDACMVRDEIDCALEASLAKDGGLDHRREARNRTNVMKRFGVGRSLSVAGTIALLLVAAGLWPRPKPSAPQETATAMVTDVAGAATGAAQPPLTSKAARDIVRPSSTARGLVDRGTGDNAPLAALLESGPFTTLLERYKAAVEAKDLTTLKAMWPGLSEGQERRIAREFEEAQSIRIDVTNAVTATTTSTAKVTGVSRIVTVDPRDSRGVGRTTRSGATVKREWLIIDLQLRNGEWVIAGVDTPIIPLQTPPATGSARDQRQN